MELASRLYACVGLRDDFALQQPHGRYLHAFRPLISFDAERSPGWPIVGGDLCV